VAALGSEKEGTPITESSERDSSRTSSDYSESKYLSELEVWRCIQEGLNAVIVNPSVIIGAGNWNAGSPSLFSNVYKGFRYYTEGVTGYVDARDVAQVMLLLMESDITAERFLVSSENVSYKQLLFQMADNLSVKPPHIQATPLLTSIAWRLDALRSWMTHTPQKISKSTAKTSFRKQYYSNQKSAQTLQFEYIPIAQSLADVSKIFLNSVLS